MGYIKHLTIIGLKKFKRLDIDFNENMNLKKVQYQKQSISHEVIRNGYLRKTSALATPTANKTIYGIGLKQRFHLKKKSQS